MIPPTTRSTLFPYTTLFRSVIDRHGAAHHYHASKVVIATGFYDLPNLMGVPGEDLPKVRHCYGEPHPYFGADVMVVGGKNSRSEEHTSELQSHVNLVCRLLL